MSDTDNADESTQRTSCRKLFYHKIKRTYLSLLFKLTAKNMQSIRTLISTAHMNGPNLNESWNTTLATIQHIVWILGMKPSLTGGFGNNNVTSIGGTDSISDASSSTVLTTAVMTDVPVLVCVYLTNNIYFVCL